MELLSRKRRKEEEGTYARNPTMRGKLSFLSQSRGKVSGEFPAWVLIVLRCVLEET